MMLSTLLSPRGGVMKSQVGCTTVRLFRDNKSIKTIMVPRPSYQTRLNQEHKLAQSKRRIIQWQSFISTIVYRLVLNNLEAAGAFSGGCRRILPQQIHIYISSPKMICLSTFTLELRHASSVWAKLFFNKQALTFTNSLTTIDPLPWISIRLSALYRRSKALRAATACIKKHLQGQSSFLVAVRPKFKKYCHSTRSIPQDKPSVDLYEPSKNL